MSQGMTVWKFHLEPDQSGVCTVEMPWIRWHLSVGEQDGQLFAWLAVDPKSTRKPVRYLVLPTGGEVLADFSLFRGTIQTANGLVFHVWSEG